MTLGEAVLDALLWLRRENRVPWDAVDTLRQVFVHRRSMRLVTMEEAAALMGFDIGTRAGWLEFAELFAKRLPEQVAEDAGWWSDATWDDAP